MFGKSQRWMCGLRGCVAIPKPPKPPKVCCHACFSRPLSAVIGVGRNRLSHTHKHTNTQTHTHTHTHTPWVHPPSQDSDMCGRNSRVVFRQGSSCKGAQFAIERPWGRHLGQLSRLHSSNLPLFHSSLGGGNLTSVHKCKCSRAFLQSSGMSLSHFKRFQLPLREGHRVAR